MEHNNTLPATCGPAPAHEPAPVPAAAPPPASYFASLSSFEAVQRMAGLLAASDMVPKQYQKSVANCVLALEVAMQTGSSPFFVMQNLDIIGGRPNWKSQFIAALLNSSRRFRGGLRYEMDNDDNPTTCRVWAIDAATGERLNGPTVSLEMARKEGWTDRLGSKWKTMPEVMLGYRAVAFFGRRHAPELLLGMRTDDEIRDMGGADDDAPQANRATPGEHPETPAAAIDALIDARASAPEPEPAPVIEAPAATPEESSAVAEAPPEPEPAPEQPAEPAEQRAAMFRYIRELEGKRGMSLEIPGWMERNHERLVNDLGGEDSEFYQAVHEHWKGLEAELK